MCIPGLFAGTALERPVTCERCEQPLDHCRCPRRADGAILLPAQQTATIRSEKRGKGKLVTAVAGLDPHASNLTELLKSLKSSCGAGGRLEAGVIELQGDHRAAVEARLREEGYKTRLVQ
jgi:translation initiation factor 1